MKFKAVDSRKCCRSNEKDGPKWNKTILCWNKKSGRRAIQCTGCYSTWPIQEIEAFDCKNCSIPVGVNVKTLHGFCSICSAKFPLTSEQIELIGRWLFNENL